ncbi:MAG: DNA repair protein RecO [Rhodobacteraceae bacterium]|nr:MAG: DNA repair protein RecO [Paracoccaceae bacterium]
MVWRDEGLMLSARRHGENDAIIGAFTAERGRIAAVVKGGAGRRLSAVLQTGDQIDLEWRARLDAHLGVARVEPVRARAGAIMGDAGALAALGSAAALLSAFLPEREAHPALYAATVALADVLASGSDWRRSYALWEMGLLADLGFGLDLSACAATGATTDLAWVSPKSGRAVSRAAGAPWADRLLPLPGFLIDGGDPARGEFVDAMRLTGWFIERRAAPALGLESPPQARARLAARFGA